MASRSISAILWTLVSVNVLTLVVGGLITWLGYAIPARLTQFGLLPELVIVAGLASLSVACLGLCALNYSSHYALNIYGLSCLIFALMLLLGIPANWYKSSQFVDGALLTDILYFSLLSVLLVLVVFALTFGQYLKRKELGLLEPPHKPSSSSSSSSQTHQSTMGTRQRRLVGDSDCNSPICACNLQALSAQSGGIVGVTDTAGALLAANNDNSASSAAKAPTCANNDARTERWFPWTSIGFGNAAARAADRGARERNTNNHRIDGLSGTDFILQQPQLQITNGNGNSSISSSNGGLCHLSDLRVPFYSTSSQGNHNATSNQRPNLANSNNISKSIGNHPCCARATTNNNVSSSSSSNAAASMPNERTPAPLIHKGFYQRIGATSNAAETGGGLVRAKSFSRPILAPDGQDEDDNAGSDDNADQPDAEMLATANANLNQLPSTATTNYGRLYRSASNHCVASQNAQSRDESSIQHGRDQYQTSQRHWRHRQRQQQQTQQAAATAANNNSRMPRQPIIMSTAAALQTSAWPDSIMGSQATLAQYASATLGKCNCYSNSEIRVNRITSPLRDTHSSSSSNARAMINCKHAHRQHRHLHHAPPLYQQQHQQQHQHQHRQQQHQGLFGLQSHSQHRSHSHLHTQHYTAPRFNGNSNSTSTYVITGSPTNRPATRQQQQHQHQRSRSKGSGSVVAMTAAAAAALFGGLTDASSLANPGQELGDGGLFAGLSDADAEALLVDQDVHCLTDSLDMNEHQHLDVSMLNAPVAIANATTINNNNNNITHDTFQENVLRQPLFGLAPLLEFSRKS